MGADFSGRKVAYGWGREATRGAAVVAAYWVRWETADLIDDLMTILNKSTLGVLDAYSGMETVGKYAQGQIAGKVTDQAIGLALWGTLGSYSKTTHAGESIVFDHTFQESQSSQSQSLTIVRVDPNIKQQYQMAMVDQFDLDLKAGDFVRHATHFKAQPGAVTAATVAYVPENEFVSNNAIVKLASSVAGLASASAMVLQSAKVGITKHVDPYWTVGQITPAEIFAKEVEVKGEVIIRYNSQQFYNLIFNNTQQAMSITITNPGVVIGNSTNPTLTFTMPAVFLDTWKVNQAQNAIVEQTIGFQAVYSVSDGYSIKAVLTNTVSNYDVPSVS